MSKVISFRLNPENPREAEALTMLDRWLSQGFSTRYTLTEALLMLDSRNSKTSDNKTLSDLSHQIQELLSKVGMGTVQNSKTAPKPDLSDGFISSIIKSAKPGLRE